MKAMSDFATLQQQWTTWLRQPESVLAPNVEARRLAIYKELFFNNVSGFVENTFPIVKQHLPIQQWQLLLKDFFALHFCQSPYFHDISHEFLQFLATQNAVLAQYPWLTELAHFEWIELAADISDEPFPLFVSGDFWQGIPVVTPYAWPLVYQWPVQQFAQSHQALAPELTCFIVYRNQTDDVQLMQSNALTLNLLQHLQQNQTQTGQAVFINLANTLNMDSDTLCQAGHAIVDEFLQANILLGVRELT